MSGPALTLVIVGAVAALVFLLRKTTPADTAQVIAFGPAPSPAVRRFAMAVARAEGFYVPNSIPARARNPGNLKLGGPNTINGITVYTSEAEGWSALYRQLNLIVSGRSRYYKLTMTIRAMGDTWAPSGDRNIPGAWSRNVAQGLGVSVEAPLSSVLA